MRIGVHMGTLRGAGTVAVGRSMAAALMRESAEPMHFWLPRDWGLEALAAETGTVLEERSATGVQNKLLLENIAIRRAIRAGRIDRLFSVGDTSLPCCAVPHLLMVQQAYLAYPANEWGTDDERLRRKMTLMNAYFRLGMATVTRYTVQTATMKIRLSERWDIAPEHIAVIPSSVPAWYLVGEALPPDDPPYICFVGSAFAHKNHTVIADALAALRTEGIRITCRITGTAAALPRLVQRACQLGVLENLQFLGPLTATEIRTLLQRAVALIMPSKLESFGLPYYEAMAAGCPVIAADRDFAREACAECALYADADDGAAFAERIALLLTAADFRNTLVEAGRERMRMLYRPWPSIARDYLKLIESLVRN
jgi:glycosyltransferase involved in cell wall biosynthesis